MRIAVLLGFLLVCSCSAPPPRMEFVLGTLCSVNLFQDGKKETYTEVFSRLREIENRMSVNIEGSDLDRINRNAGLQPVQVHEDVIEVIAAALRFAELSSGAFDPSVGPLVSLWGIGSDRERVPDPGEIASALALVDWRDIVIDREAKSVFLRKPGMALDLGGIAKGYAADEIARLLRGRRVKRAIIDLGGNILAYGAREDGSPWRIGIQDPAEGRGNYLGICGVRDTSLVTSGVYERFFHFQGKDYHHILSARDGYPVDNGLLAVSILAASSMEADALSTAVFALGFEQGRELIGQRAGVEALFIFDDLSIWGTEGALELFTLTDTDYRIRTSSISKTRKAFPGMAPFPAPRSP